MVTVARDFHDTIVWIQEGGFNLKSPWERVKTVFLICDLKQIYTKLCTNSISVSKAENPPGMCAVAADLHDTPQGVHHKFSCIRPAFFTDPHFEGWWKRIKTVFIPPIESPYTTIYQTVRTCHDISLDEVA